MQYNFDEVIDRRHDKYSYSMKWSKSPLIAEMLGVDEITDDSIAVFTADMDFHCAPPIIEAMHKVADHGIFGYSMQLETPDYYAAVINWFKRRNNWAIKPEEIVYVNGTVEAVKQIILAFTDPGDGVIIQRPVYGPFTSSILSTGRVVVNNQMIEEADGYYTMDFADLEEKAKDPRNKLLVLCSPHNPVGRIWTDEELVKMAHICRENNVIIASDEIHGDLIRREAEFHPLATLVDNSNLIIATAVNKTFNLAGLHCTNLVIPNPELRKKFQESLGFVMPSPFTIAAVIAAYNEGENWLEAVRDYLDGNIDWILGFLKEKMPKVKCRRPDGTYIMWMDFRGYGLTPEEVHDKIYNKAKVLLEGGPMFDPDRGGGFERICVPSPRSVIQDAFERIAAQFEGL
ncbi:MAG: MalY/PatB family protein [Oscillospiraceae bacterium]